MINTNVIYSLMCNLTYCISATVLVIKQDDILLTDGWCHKVNIYIILCITTNKLTACLVQLTPKKKTYFKKYLFVA